MTVPLSRWPTPLDPAPRLARAIGLHPADLWVKRDDLTDLGGGNKIRKLEHLFAEAEGAGATVLVTEGGVQSNHARMTAAAAARRGLGCVLVLSGDPDPRHPGNLALEGLFGARVVVGPAVDDVVAQLREAGERPSVIPLGGSSVTGARGYLTCAAELAEQAPDAVHVVTAVGSGGTMAGLVAGLGAARVLGVHTGAVPDPEARVAALVAALGGSAAGLRLRTDQVGDGYGALTTAAEHAIRTAAATEGLVLEPTYTGKALAGLVAAVQEGAVRPGERTVWLHTGGLPGLFGHPFAEQVAREVLDRS
ncbi:pyridoxal-phosphate dependent enzyme [Klenkia brasiliensis]|uniref:D-cysteine desulfhydrase n=1 Tax=Klenkia brasiliensis TaxID=333142 RepID=A0A1G7YTV8_9ACTN|nr:pyridoxal-phosphate dependent enzyme [Klenkia brasiliensis]SDG99795.1 D-cysteine desulfhydrase [Klenkia brasiliensis]